MADEATPPSNPAMNGSPHQKPIMLPSSSPSSTVRLFSDAGKQILHCQSTVSPNPPEPDPATITRRSSRPLPSSTGSTEPITMVVLLRPNQQHHDHAPCANNSSTRTIQPDLHHISTSAGVRSHQPSEEVDSALLPHLQSTSITSTPKQLCPSHLHEPAAVSTISLFLSKTHLPHHPFVPATIAHASVILPRAITPITWATFPATIAHEPTPSPAATMAHRSAMSSSHYEPTPTVIFGSHPTSPHCKTPA
ncbi:hypothetical protein ACLOJK_035034, partial [Asimina triloba]